MSNKFVHILCCGLLVVSAFASCHRRPLFDAEERIEIKVLVNIKAIANVTTGIYNEKIPVPDLTTEMMRVMVYDPTSKNLLTQSFISNRTVAEDGSQILEGTLNISYGSYDFVVYNFDNPTTQIRDENNEKTILAYTSPISPAMRARYLSKAGEEETLSINYEPDHLVVAREHDLYISPHDTLIVVETEARTIVDTYYIQIHVEGMEYASSANAVISGLSPSNLIGYNERTEDPTAAVAFDLVKSQDDRYPGENKDVLCAVFNTFGKIESASSELYVTFNVVDTEGNLLQYQTSLDTIFKTQEAIENHWLLIDDTWVIPNPKPNPSGGGGFQPQVDDWEEEEGSISL